MYLFIHYLASQFKYRFCSLGFIDPGYTSKMITIFGNLDKSSHKYQRITQICPPDLSFSFKPHI